ncbi:hypothetical protein [Campylobacter sp. US33a]|nr:hypothetical protein [Campylobacter sp. US33a]
MNKKQSPVYRFGAKVKTEEDYFNSLFKYLNYDNVKIDVKKFKK